MRKKIFYFLPLIALASCTSNDLTGEQREPVVVGDQEIVLSSGIGNLPLVDTPNSRAVINTALPTGGLDVAIIRLDETGDPKAFPLWNTVATSTDVLSAHVDATTKQVAFNDGATPTPAANPQYYQANGNKTRLQGFYPKDGTVSAGVIEWTIDGAKDIMVSNYADGDKTDKFGSSKTLTFQHLLTQIIVEAYATDQDALDAWGNILKISIKDQNLTCKYTLADGAVGNGAFSGKTGTSHLEIRKKKIDDSPLSPDYAADGSGLAYDVNNDRTKATMCGYAMFEPATTANSAILIIETATGGTINKPIPEVLEKGYAYNVVLKFTATEIIPEVAISQWQTGGDVNIEM